MVPPVLSAPSRRRFLNIALRAAGSAAALSVSGRRLAAETAGPATDVVRLTWGLGGLPGLAKQRGEFVKLLAEQGIKVEWIGPFPNHAPSIQAVTGGSADFSFGGSTTPALAAIIAGSPLVFAQFGVIEPRTTAIIAKDGSGIEKIEDLVGKSVAVNRSGVGEFLLVAALEKHGVDRSLVKVVYLNPPEAAPAFASGKVDAWSMWSPGVDIARSEHKAHDVFVDGRDLDFQIDFMSYLVARKFSEQNASLVKAVNAAYAAEAQWVSENTREAESIAQKIGSYSDQIRESFIAQKHRYKIIRVDDHEFLERFQKAADWLTERKVLPEKVTVTDHLAQI